MVEEKYYTVEEALNWLSEHNVHPHRNTFYIWIQKGKLKAKKFHEGGQWFTSETWLNEFLEGDNNVYSPLEDRASRGAI